MNIENIANTAKPETFFKGILYHGSKKKLSFNPEFDYSDPNQVQDGSFTLGEGMYFTDEQDAALEYARVRSNGEGYVFEVNASHVRFLDLRSNGENISVEKVFIKKWIDYFSSKATVYLSELNDRLEEKIKIKADTQSDRIPTYIEKLFIKRIQNYLNYLKYIEDKKITAIDLRILLGSVPRKYIPNSNNAHNYEGGDFAPKWSRWFRDFILSMGYDGIIYIEGNEDISNPSSISSFVIYNLDLIEPLS